MTRFEIFDKRFLTDLSVDLGPEKQYGDISLYFLKTPLNFTFGKKSDRKEYSFVGSSYHCVERRNRTFESRGESIAINVTSEQSELLSELGALLQVKLLEKDKRFEEYNFSFIDDLNETLRMKTTDTTKVLNVRTGGKEMILSQVTQGSCVHLLWQLKTVWVNRQNGTAGCVPKIHTMYVVDLAVPDEDVIDDDESEFDCAGEPPAKKFKSFH